MSGLERQLALCDSASAPSWCSDTQLLSQLRTALDRLWSTIVNNADVAFSEVGVVTKKLACLLLLLLPVHGCEARQRGLSCVPPMPWLVGCACAGQALQCATLALLARPASLGRLAAVFNNPNLWCSMVSRVHINFLLPSVFRCGAGSLKTAATAPPPWRKPQPPARRAMQCRWGGLLRGLVCLPMPTAGVRAYAPVSDPITVGDATNSRQVLHGITRRCSYPHLERDTTPVHPGFRSAAVEPRLSWFPASLARSSGKLTRL